MNYGEQIVPGFAYRFDGEQLVSERSDFQQIDIYENPSFGRLLMLDGPSTGLAPTLVKDVMELVKRIKDEAGVSVLLVEQNVAAALAIADRAYLMKSGRIIRAARPDELYDAATLWSLF